MERISYYAVGHLSYLNPDSSCTLYWVTGIEPRVRCYIRFTSGRVKLLMDGHKVRSLKKERMRVYWHKVDFMKNCITANLLRKQNKSYKNKTV